MIPYLADHLPSLLALVAAITAMARARSRRDAASAEAVEQLTAAHQSCEVRVRKLARRMKASEKRQAITDRKAAAAETRAGEADKRASKAEEGSLALSNELRELRQEIQR